MHSLLRMAERLILNPLVGTTHFKGRLIEVNVVTKFFQWGLWVSGSKLSSFLYLFSHCHIDFLNRETLIRRHLRKSINILNLKVMMKHGSDLVLKLPIKN